MNLKRVIRFLVINLILIAVMFSLQIVVNAKYLITDKYISNVLPETSIETFKSNINEEVKVYENDTKENEVTSGRIKTGMLLEYTSNNKILYISVLGDLNQDGMLNQIDLTREIRDVTNSNDWKIEAEIEILSGDMDKNKKIDSDDIEEIINYIVYDKLNVVKFEDIEDDELLFGMPKEKYTEDGDEDKDGLTNAEEETLGTNVYKADTDEDGLTDYYEIYVSGTNPLIADSDNDGINDGDEVAMELNPLAIDSKGDGINDSERTLIYEVSNDELGVNIEITGKGNIASSTIDALEYSENNDILNTIYNFHTYGTIENAIVTINYSIDELEEKGLIEDNITLYYLNNKTQKLEEINSTINKDNKTISAALEHFSMYIIGKKELDSFIFASKPDSWIDINQDGTIDEIVIVNSGFNPKINGFSFENFGSSKSSGGNCYGMATFAMAYYLDRLPMKAEHKKFWHFWAFDTWESNGYDLTDTYFADGGNLYDFKISSEPLKYLLEYPLKDLMEWDNIKDGFLKIKEEYYKKLEKIGTIFIENKVTNKNNYDKYQYPLLNVESVELKNSVTNNENQMFNAIWNLYMLQANDKSTSFGSEPDQAFKELMANLQNGVPVVLGISNDEGAHAINAISLIQDLDNPNQYKIAIYDNNYPGEVKYIYIKRYKQNKYELNWTSWTNQYGYKVVYEGEEVNFEIFYPQIEENNSIYVKLYDDGTLAFTSTDKELKGKTLVKSYGDIYGKEFNSYLEVPWHYENYKVKNVDVVDKIKPKSTAYWFSLFTNLESINNIGNLDTSEVKNMKGMFKQCSNLKSIDVSNFDTSKVTDMSEMFWLCHNLINLDLSNFDTSKVMNMSGMFYDCERLKSVNLSRFNTSKVTDMSSMFSNCIELESLNISSFNTTSVTNMREMFHWCESLKKLDLSNFDTTKVTDMSGMFCLCKGLTNLNLSNFNTNQVSNMENMFSDCVNLENIDVSSFNTSKVTDMSGMFKDCYNLASVDVSNFDTKNVISMARMFCGLKITTLNLTSFNTNSVRNMEAMFCDSHKLSVIYVGDGWTTKNVSNKVYMFLGCEAYKVTNI